MKLLRVVIVGGNTSYVSWLYDDDYKVELVPENMFVTGAEVDLAIFTGGQDVSPSVYGDTPNRATYSHPDRDLKEFKIYHELVKRDIPKVGICRGAQFMTAVQPNGFLIQDVTNHSSHGGHDILDIKSKKTYRASSTHHQMMYPFNIEGHLIIAATHREPLSDRYEVGSKGFKGFETFMLKKGSLEPEVVFYEDDKALCIQGHPEYFPNTEKFPTYCRELVKEYLL